MSNKPRIAVGIIGHGSVGTALETLIQRVLHPQYTVYTYDFKDDGGFDDWPAEVDILHYTIPCEFPPEWASTFYEYVSKTQPAYVIIDATITPNVLDLLKLFHLQCNIYVSPVRATEAIMFDQLAEKPKYIAPIQEWPGMRPYINQYLNNVFDNKAIWFADPKALILGKLFETAQFGVNIALVQQLAATCRVLNIDFNEAYTIYMQDTAWRADYTGDNMKFIPRPLFRPDTIGGKCVMQNIDLLDKNVSKFGGIWEWVRKSNAS